MLNTVRKTQIKTTLRLHLLLFRMVKIKKKKRHNVWQLMLARMWGRGGGEHLFIDRVMPTFIDTEKIGVDLGNPGKDLSQDPVVLLQRHLFTHCCSVHNRQKLGTA
jgi:hypothetical protein